MRTQYKSLTVAAGNEVSDPIILNDMAGTWDVSIKIDELTDGATVKVQYSLDDPRRCIGIGTVSTGGPIQPDITPVWHDHATETGKTASTTPVTITIPCTMFRLVATAGSAGVMRLAVVQFG